ncbi:MAG: response regulator transcription factor [Paracoccaceae bacterium]|nr:response regulator transcription factor [Paracoccaceae bacterium]
MTTLVYLLEDDLDISRLIERSLAQQGITTRAFRRLAEFERELRRQLPDLCLIDLSLPDGDGLSLINGNALPEGMPRVIVTGRGSVTDKVVGLEIGADDYITKPFEPRELVARLRAVLRRSRKTNAPPETHSREIAIFGDWTADLTACTLIHADGHRVTLSSSENSLLEAFLRAPGRVLSRSNLLDATHGRANEPFDRSMDARICRLRRKIEKNPKDAEVIRTVYGAGYIFTSDVDWR